MAPKRANTPITIPAMAPPETPLLSEEPLLVGEGDAAPEAEERAEVAEGFAEVSEEIRVDCESLPPGRGAEELLEAGLEAELEGM